MSQFEFTFASMKSLLLLVHLCLPLLFVSAANERSRAFERVGGRQVTVYTSKMNWFKAAEICKKRGMQLLTINSARENLEVVQLGQEYGLEWVWIGATDLGERRRWVWAHNGELVRERYWKDGEPSNKRENCIEAMSSGYPMNWNDNDCRRVRPFMCEEVARRSSEERSSSEEDRDSDEDEYY